MGHPLTLAQVRGACCRAGDLVGGGFPPGVTSHMLGTWRLTLMSRRKGSLYLAAGGDKAEATQATTSPQCLGQSEGPFTPKSVQGEGPEQSICHG